MVELLIAVALMVAVVGSLLAWVVRADRRRRFETVGGPSRSRREEVT
jgi:hypothetical protein